MGEQSLVYYCILQSCKSNYRNNNNNNNNLFIKCLLCNRLRLSKSDVQSSCCIKHKIKLKDIKLRFKINVNR